MLNLMKTLTAVRGISGYEKAVSDKLMMTVAPLCDRVYNDAMGSLIAYRQGSAPEGERRSVMLCAHMDEIGFLVTLIDDNGFIRVAPVGGIHCVAAAYATVVFGNGTKGVLVPEAGTAPADLKTEKMYVDILSYDSDFFQLLSNRVSQLRYRGKLTVCWDPNTFREKFGIEPEQYADFKSLTGDASDNIRGAERVGPKTAAKLLRQHGTLEALLTGAEEISQPALRESILSSRERLLRNRALIRLEGTVPLPFMPEEMTFVLPEESSGSILRRLEIL